MYSRRICEKCNLTVYAKPEEELDGMTERYRCKCGSQEKEKIPEYIGIRILRSKDNIRLVT